jgi:hypothetical protein
VANNRAIAAAAARRARMPVQLFLRQMNQEAGFRDATSPAGAQGPAQIMPATARAWGVRNVHDPNEAYNAAAQHMRQYHDQFGSWAKALIAYNAGPGAVSRGSLPAETRNYIARIMGGGVSTGHATPASSRRSNTKAAARRTVDTVTPGTLSINDTVTPASEQPSMANAALMALQESSGKVRGSLKRSASGGGLAGRTLSLYRSGQATETVPTSSTSTIRSTPTTITSRNVPVPPHSGKPGRSGSTAAPTNTKGTAMFEGQRVAAWIVPELRYAREHGWTGKVISGFRSFADQTRIYNSGVRPAAKPGHSNHEGADFPRGAVDVSPESAAQLAAILRKKPGGSPLIYAGAKDPVHFSHPHNGGY